MQARIGEQATHLGYDTLRPGQPEAVEHVLEGRDALVIMPTGYGKSAIYQIAGALLPGATAVVSPLLALQKDQVDAIQEQSKGEAAQVNSLLPASRRRAALDKVEEGELEFVFLAPEQLRNDVVVEHLSGGGVSLFVVDEAHCISAWGHDFRPDYLLLGSIVDRLGRPAVLALTSTASPPVRNEIIEHLHMRDPAVIVCGFDRPNLWLGVETFHDVSQKQESLLDQVEAADKPGIVYAATRAECEQLAEKLEDRGVKAAFYHAGMKRRQRDDVQQRFMDDRLEVVVATTAFGMGIDKANVRFVVHYDVPDSIDSYYQEVGRAGRDGEPARAQLFYRAEDLGIRRFFAASGQLAADEIEQVVAAIQRSDEPVALDQLSRETPLSDPKLRVAIGYLEQAGAVKVLAQGDVVPTADLDDPSTAAKEVSRSEQSRRAAEGSRLEMMRGYAETRECRREFLLNYFGQAAEPTCGYCDNCEAGRVSDEDEEEIFPINSRVAHSQWGEGLVMRYEGRKIVVLFDDVGYKSLLVDLAVDRRLLSPIPDRS